LDLFMTVGLDEMVSNFGQIRQSILCQDPVIILTGADLTPEQHMLLAEFGSQMMSKSTLRQKELLIQLESALNQISGSNVEGK